MKSNIEVNEIPLSQRIWQVRPEGLVLIADVKPKDSVFTSADELVNFFTLLSLPADKIEVSVPQKRLS